jgi:hypothetical protein
MVQCRFVLMRLAIHFPTVVFVICVPTARPGHRSAAVLSAELSLTATSVAMMARTAVTDAIGIRSRRRA